MVRAELMNMRYRQRFSLFFFPISFSFIFLFLSLGAKEARSDAETVEFCLLGEFDLGLRLQGMDASGGEFSASRWCVITEDESERVHFDISGQSNPDMTGSFAVSYLLPDVIRIVNRESPPDVEFSRAAIAAEALRHRRIDPLRLVEEIVAHPKWVMSETEDGWREVKYPGSEFIVRLWIDEGRLYSLVTFADLPLRGRVPVRWEWNWADVDEPALSFYLDGEVIFEAVGSWRALSGAEASALWELSGGAEPVSVPGEYWPARVNMELHSLGEGVYVVRGVRTGFHHLVVDTAEGLLIADAPAGWVELPQIPPADLVPGLGISGLSEGLIDFLSEKLPGRTIRAVALSHAHDDHAGGARAFAAVGAAVYAPASISDYLSSALNRSEMPADRLSAIGGEVVVLPVADRVRLDDDGNAVELLSIGPGPHVSASLGVWAVDAGYFFQSDLHVPNSEADVPRADRAQTECWFASWAVAHLPPEVIVLNSHTLTVTPVARLARYLESGACQ
jgi:glyoxylase-like metal-dependent hydrolase (beta-lactamase superfamily II)